MDRRSWCWAYVQLMASHQTQAALCYARHVAATTEVEAEVAEAEEGEAVAAAAAAEEEEDEEEEEEEEGGKNWRMMMRRNMRKKAMATTTTTTIQT